MGTHGVIWGAIGLITSAVAAPRIHHRPIPYGETRAALTRAYLQKHTGLTAPSIEIVPRVIVLHWTANGTLEGAWRTFAPERLAGRPDIATASALNVSAHFLVDRDGTIYQLMDTTRVARHVIGLNHLSIGIENVGGGEQYPLTDAQLHANIVLVQHLTQTHPTITHVIGHHEYRQMEGHPYFQEQDPTYRTAKVDPGAAFVTAVRAATASLGVEGPPPP